MAIRRRKKSESTRPAKAEQKRPAPDPLDGIDVDGLAERWAAGEWTDEDHATYGSLDPDAQARLKAELKRRA